MTKAGNGSMVLSGTNTCTGVTTLSAGTLSVGSIGNGGVSGNLGAASSAAANLVFDGGTLQSTGTTAGTNRNFTINAGETRPFDITTNTLTVSGASTATNGALTKTGAGTLTLSGANLSTGATTIHAGMLKVENDGTTTFGRGDGAGSVRPRGLARAAEIAVRTASRTQSAPLVGQAPQPERCSW